MEIKELEKEDVREYVKFLIRCNDELARIFGDAFLAVEVMTNHYMKMKDYSGIFVAKTGRKVAGLVEVWIREIDRGIKLKEFVRAYGFLRGLRVKLLHSFFNLKPKRGEAYLRYFCVHPEVGVEVAEKLLDSGIRFAEGRGKKRVLVWLPVKSDLVDVCIDIRFEIKRMLDSSFAEKHFGRRYYYLLQKTLY